jgi:hypothetical protein
MQTPRTSSRHSKSKGFRGFILRLARSSRRTRLFFLIGAGALVIAVVLLVVFLALPDSETVKQASAGGLPVPTGTPEGTATLPPLPTPSL